VRLNLVATLRAILQPYVAGDRLPRNAASGSPTFQYPPLSKAPKKLHGSITTKKSSDGRALVDGGRALTRDEVALLLTHSSPQYWTVLLTMVYTGMRLGEVLAMQWEYLTEGYDGVRLYPVEYNVDRRGQLMRCQDKILQGRDRPLFGRRRGIARTKGNGRGGETEGGQRLDESRSYISAHWFMSALGQSPGTRNVEKRIGSRISAGGHRTCTPARSAAYVRELANCRGTQYQTSVEPFAALGGRGYA
jgi:integrase